VRPDDGSGRKGWKDTVEDLYGQYGGLVYRRCLRILGSSEEAESAVQEVFLRVMKKLRKQEAVGNARNYLFRVSTNYCLNRLRNRRRLPPFVGLEAVPISGGQDPETHTVHALLLEQILRTMRRKQRLAVYLHFCEGFTQSEVASTLEVSRQSVNKMISRARRKLDTAAEVGGPKS